ncbi:MAG: hypothetical protein ACXVEF_40630, partial [Polyangiales bacterium]
MRSLRCAAMLFAASSVGCFGVYVEGQATYYPSLKYTENDNPDPAAKVAPPTGGAFAVGINLGIDFEGQRSGRFALGYVVQTMPVPDGKATGGQTDARFEIKLARLAAAQRLRLGLGFGLGNATTTMKKADGSGDIEKKGGMGSFYGGLVYAHYFGKHNEIAVGGYGQYFAVSAPNG